MTGGQSNRQPPSYHNIEGGSSNYNEVSPPSYEEAINPNGEYNTICLHVYNLLRKKKSYSFQHHLHHMIHYLAG